jgi:hypothetical protein
VIHRVAQLGAGVGELIDRVPDPEIAACAYLLTISAISAVDLGDEPELSDALTALREQGRVTASARLHVATMLSQREHQSFAAARRGDEGARDRYFFQARAVNCLALATGAVGARTDGREMLREVAYEAAVAMRGGAGVVGVLTQYSA